MFDPFSGGSHADFVLPAKLGLGLGQEYLLTGSDQLVQVASNAFGGPGGSGVAGAGGASPASTLVGNPHGLEINLIWDNSVASAPNWQAIESSVVSAAQIFTGLFRNHDILNIAVGFGEVAGQALPAGALGESASFGYLLPNDGTFGALLGAADAGLVHTGLMAANATTALDAVAGSFFITSANAKALGLVDPAAGLDGFIGFSSTAPISFGQFLPSGSQYDAIGVAAHEISEVMGRIGLEGATLVATDGTVFPNVYTPLDEFRYSAPGVPDVTPSAGYFSLNDGATQILPFNDPNNFGDAADWATAPVTQHNAFDAFASTGRASVTAADVLAMAAIGYRV
jgi:hypothetical protein